MISLRKWCGPEYRNITFLFRAGTQPLWGPKYTRIPKLKNANPIRRGFVRHYGKSISVKHWEETCRHYINTSPNFRTKWQKRLGKAIHTKSDFGMDFITWDEKETKGVHLGPIEKGRK